MFWSRKWAQELPPIARSSKVPPLSEWTSSGVVGLVQLGPCAGQYVLAEPYWDSAGQLGAWVFYTSNEMPLLGLDREVLLEDDSSDGPRAEGGSFIDEITDAVDIRWSTESVCVEHVVRQRFARLLEQGD